MKNIKWLNLALAAAFSLTIACSDDDGDGNTPKADADPNACPVHEVCYDAAPGTPDAAPAPTVDAMPAAQ